MSHGGMSAMVLVLLLYGCNREIPVAESPNVIGYEVQGTVTDQIGNPIPYVKVLVDYTLNLVGGDTAATRGYFFSEPTAAVQTVVVNWDNQIVRALTQPQNYSGWYEILWDGKDSSGTLVPSGIYYVQYRAGGVVRFSYNQLVSGGEVATTDVQGNYTIPIQNLPIDSSSVPDFSYDDSTYDGNLQVTNDIIFTYIYGTNVKQIERELGEGQITVVNVIF